MSEEVVEKNGLEAMEAYVTSVTYPIVWTDDNQIFTLGSAALFQFKQRRFLLTARHTFDEYPKKYKSFPFDGLYGPTSLQIGRPATPPRMIGKTRPFLTKGAAAIKRDVVAIELLDGSFIDAISKDWQFLRVENFAVPDWDSHYFVSGFPNEREQRSGEAVGASCMRLNTIRHPGVPSDVKNYDRRYDLILDYDKEGVDTRDMKTKVISPFAAGISGGPVLRQTSKLKMKVWTPRNALNFVGLQVSSTRANQWLRATNVHAVHRYFDDAIPSIGKAIAKQLGKDH